MKILKESYAEAKRLLSEHRETMDQIAEFLIEKETITGKEFMKIYRKCEGIPEPEPKEKEQEAPKEPENPEKLEEVREASNGVEADEADKEMVGKSVEKSPLEDNTEELEKPMYQTDEDGFILPQEIDKNEK